MYRYIICKIGSALRTGKANFLMRSTALETQHFGRRVLLSKVLDVVKILAMKESYRWSLNIRFPIRNTTFITKTEKKDWEKTEFQVINEYLISLEAVFIS